MAARVDIFNSALGHIAQGDVLSDPNDVGEAGRACRRFYPGARDTVLASHWWRFATRFSALEALATVPPGSAYAFAEPNGCLEILRVTEFDDPLAPALDWRLGGVTSSAGDDSIIILTDMPAGFIKWMRRVENEALYKPHFVKALEWLLASEIASTFVRDASRRIEAFQRYEYWLEQAKIIDQRQVQERPGKSDFVTRRV